MYRELQIHENKARNAMRAVVADVKRGTLVTVDGNGALVAANGEVGLRIANRGLNKEYYKSLNGVVSEYDVIEDTIKAGEFVAEVAMESGEKFAFEVATPTLVAFPNGSFLEATSGVFTKKDVGESRFISRGIFNDNGHALLIVEIL